MLTKSLFMLRWSSVRVSNRKIYLLWCIIVFTILLLFVIRRDLPQTEQLFSEESFISTENNRLNSEEVLSADERSGVSNTFSQQNIHPLIYVLWWEENAISWLGGHMVGPLKNCPVPCIYTNDLKKYNESSALIFHIPTFLDFPKDKLPHHKWVAFSMESEQYYPALQDEKFMSKFDWKMTYRLDSDFVAGYWSSNETLYLLPPHNKTSSVPVVYVASNCRPLNRRDDYVEELMKHIAVDSYGRCLHNKDMNGTGTRGKLDTIGRYKFYLAFENNNAMDYVTEKFFQALIVGTVPVYMGAPNIEDFSPSSHSVIRVNDFKSPADLATYLKFLDEHPPLYNEYLAWKKDGLSEKFKKLLKLNAIDARCRLCMKLSQRSSF